MAGLDVNASLSTPVLELGIATEISALPAWGRQLARQRDSARWHQALQEMTKNTPKSHSEVRYVLNNPKTEFSLYC